MLTRKPEKMEFSVFFFYFSICINKHHGVENPVSFQFKESRECDTATGPVRYGFLAQEVLAAEGENPVIVDTEVPDHLKVTNDHFNAVLVKAIQELSAKVDSLERKLATNG